MAVILHIPANGGVEEIELVSSAVVTNDTEEEVSCIAITVLREQAEMMENSILKTDVGYKMIKPSGLIQRTVTFYLYAGDKFAISQR